MKLICINEHEQTKTHSEDHILNQNDLFLAGARSQSISNLSTLRQERELLCIQGFYFGPLTFKIQMQVQNDSPVKQNDALIMRSFGGALDKISDVRRSSELKLFTVVRTVTNSK